MRVRIPPGLEQQRGLGPEWATWLDQLPGIAATVLDEWSLVAENQPWHGFCALVLPVKTSEGRSAALKIHLPDDESEHEHLALQRWQGNGAVQLLRADPWRRVLLLERLHREDLTDAWDIEACEIVGALYARLHVRSMPQLRDQASYVVGWIDALHRDASMVPVPRRLVDQAIGLARELCAEPASAVLHGDLHYENVLRGERDGEAEWLAIDPKPTNGDPHSELEPMLRNRFEEYLLPGAVGSVRDGVRRRFHALVDAAGMDEARARDWAVVRSVLNAHWAHKDAVRAGRGLTADEREHVTACITIAKAVQN